MPTSPDNAPPPSPRHVGDYLLLREIGSGGQGTVWLAEDRIGRRLAFKWLRDRQGTTAGQREEDALRHYQDASDDPCLLRVLHVGVHEDRLCYAMELADDRAAPGEAYAPVTLARELAARGHLPPDEATAILLDVLRGLRSLHAKGLIHRDIKPPNILRAGGRWKLADIGLVTLETTDVSVLGTVEFMPPNGPLDRTADLYACGRVLYCMLSGMPARSFPTLPRTILERDSDDLRHLVAIVNRACDLRPERRFADVDAFIEALEGVPDAAGPKRWGRRAAIVAGVLGVCAWPLFRPLGARTPRSPVARLATWRPLFNGIDLSGWRIEEPIHGLWAVKDGRIHCARTMDFKTLRSAEELAPGSLRLTIVPDHPGARMGIRYAEAQRGGGHLFMCMGEKYTWLRGSRAFHPPDQPGNWFSFPGPIPQPGQEMTLEVQWGPWGHRLLADCRVLHELQPTEARGTVSLHVWSDDAGAFSGIEYRPGPPA